MGNSNEINRVETGRFQCNFTSLITRYHLVFERKWKKTDGYLHCSTTFCLKITVHSYEIVKDFNDGKFSFNVHAVIIGSHANEKLFYKNLKESQVIFDV